MGVLEFIFGLILLVFVCFTIIGSTVVKYDSERLERENKELKERLKKRVKRQKEENK